MKAEKTVRSYYDSLRNGEPLHTYFADGESLVKFGISERLVGYEEVSEGLRDQTRRTEDWVVESNGLRVTERERHAWFSDTVRMAWRDAEKGKSYDFDSRWSGTLEKSDGEWLFVSMHVSTRPDSV